MKAVIQSRYGSPEEVLSVRDIPIPVPADDEVLVRVHAASMHPDIWHVVMGLPYLLRLMGNGLRKPKCIAPGSDLSGRVEAVGKNVSRFKVGDEVFGESVKFGWRNGGAYAEYAAVPEDLLALKPADVSHEQAAAVPTAGYIAWSNLGPKNKSGWNVLINGAGGCMGPLALQIAKADGARVTAVDCAEKLPMLRSLGADQVIDYRQENLLKRDERYDLILDVASNLWYDVCAHLLTPNGTYIPIGHADYGKATGRMGGRIVGSVPLFMGLLLRSLLNAERRKEFKTTVNKQLAITKLASLLESGKLTPIIGKTFSLNEVATAMRCMEQGSIIGRIIITP